MMISGLMTVCVFTLIGVADINGFIDVACRTYDRKEISEEGAT